MTSGMMMERGNARDQSGLGMGYIAIGSISVASSSGARELFTRFDTLIPGRAMGNGSWQKNGRSG
jgi:hypothetical protein